MLSIENYTLELYLILEVEETHKILCMYLSIKTKVKVLCSKEISHILIFSLILIKY